MQPKRTLKVWDFDFETSDIDVFLNVSNVSISHSTDRDTLHRIVTLNRWLFIIIPICLYLLGIPGNIVTICVFKRRMLRRNFFSKFLIILCVNNIVCLFIGLSRHFVMGLIGWNFRLYSKTACFLHMFVLATSMCYGSWLLVLITATRAYYMAYPESFRGNTSWTKSIMCTALMWIVIAVPEVILIEHGKWTTRHSPDGDIVECEMTKGDVTAVISMILFGYLPGFCITLLNLFIYFIHNKRTPSSMMHRTSTINIRKQLYVLIIVTTCNFILTNIPLAIYYSTFGLIFDIRTDLGKAKAKLGLGISALVYYSGLSFNILIYCLFGSIFRAEVIKIFSPILRSFGCFNKCLHKTMVEFPSQTFDSETVTHERSRQGSPGMLRSLDDLYRAAGRMTSSQRDEADDSDCDNIDVPKREKSPSPDHDDKSVKRRSETGSCI